MVSDLKVFLDDLKVLRSAIKRETVKIISKQALRNRVEEISTQWFSRFRSAISLESCVDESYLVEQDERFKKLLKLSASQNRKSSYEAQLKLILKDFSAKLLVPIQTIPKKQIQESPFQKFLSEIQSLPEFEYLSESLECAIAGHRRASAVMGWCAVIARVHAVIEKIGFTSFNSASTSMKQANQGRFKRFSKEFAIGSINELGEIFDTDILWVLEYMGLIDMNEHTRLRSCFELRCQSAHPGNAKVTDYNLLSFFSDIKEIVLANPKFRLN